MKIVKIWAVCMARKMGRGAVGEMREEGWRQEDLPIIFRKNF